MEEIFRLDGVIMNFLSKVSDICIISILWLLCCLPMVTIGASTTAAYYTIVKVVRRQTGTLHQEFVKSFKSNFKDSLLTNLIYLVIKGILGVNICLVFQSLETTNSSFALDLLFIYVIFFLLVIGVEIYTYPILSRFVMGRIQLVMFSIMLLFRHFPTTLLFITLFILSVVIMIVFPVGVIFMPGFCLYFYSNFMEKIIRKYMTEEMKKTWDELGKVEKEN
ncbi:uncharacterized protein DUF624 [Lachnotalea glycerini]|uniref:DUF624 domain-containing protein n=1 Tax=Lachnotalea glycerini TaxID=1763509 RepID=A0A318ESD1_9FIRM|nr:YesL family protein [Lachnotalea glycerini]PXV95849.1 uncharacterized protein DUF624 [Lachnotalea glycerini]RDY33093.1 DUF624 domain-containing protein [Lachnotalea glycerini]